MSAANRRRGHDAERAVVAWLRENGYPDAMTTRARLGHDGANAPGDVWAVPGVLIEVKDVAKSAWPAWREQAKRDAEGRLVPLVVRRTRGIPNVGLWVATIPEWDVPVECVGDFPTTECPRTGITWSVGSFSSLIEVLR